MRDRVSDLAPAATRLGQLQRGRGAGFRAALAAGDAAGEDVLQCLIADPRIDRQIEARERYYAELVAALDVPLAPLVAHLSGRAAELGHAVLAGAWRLGHRATRALLADPGSDEALVTGIAEQLWGLQWAALVDLPPRAARVFLRQALAEADCARSAQLRPSVASLRGEMSVPQLLEFGRQLPHGQRWAVVEELCRRGTEADRSALAATVTGDRVYDRVRLAAQALGTLGDERLLPVAIDYFGREDVFADPARRLSGADRMRRSALNDYVQHLPVDRQLELARDWHARGGYFEVVAGFVFGAQATPDDRTRLEAFVAEHGGEHGGSEVIFELDALGRIGDPRSAPLLIDVAATARYSHARRRALHALAGMQQVPAAVAALHEALWDSEDEAAADGCSFLPSLDGGALARVGALAAHCLAAEELRLRAGRRLARERRATRGQPRPS
ncbi:MAG: hypothetical protein JNM25_11350 [Planctomycetes bacterium]|nr:hypothetical protein [Planctomycetota bacterium]